MIDDRRVYSECGSRIIEVVSDKNGLYTLREFAPRYDPEEEVTYEVRVEPNISSKFDKLDTALNEAKRLIDL